MAQAGPGSVPRDGGIVDISHAGPRTGGDCNVCESFNPYLPHSDRTRLLQKGKVEASISFRTSLHQLSEAAAANGCAGCALLHAAFSPFYNHLAPGHPVKIELKYDKRSNWESAIPGTAVLGTIVEFTDLTKYKPGYVPDYFEFFSPEGANDDASQPRKPFLSPRLPSNTADAQCLRWVQERLEECQSSHEPCRRRSTVSFSPTRLLRIPFPDHGTPVEQVYVVDDPGRPIRYACLSHRWGDPAKMFRTTKATLPQNKLGIEVAKLPQTFQDCISFARDLGIGYLWIDSICIVQDDSEDWRREASRMCSVYENAYVTIAAAKAADGSAGLFSDIHPGYRGHKVATIGGLHDVYFRRALDHGALSYFSPERYLSDYPLLYRGWVYQERFLSTRFLYFGTSELILECLTDTVSQCGDGVVSSHIKNQERKALHFRSLETSHYSTASFWQYMVMDYTKLALSYSRDYFPALAGLAKQWQARTQARYIAGMWMSSLLNDMQWVVPNGKQKEHPGRWRAPSWSWAAVDSEVRYRIPPATNLDDGATVKEVRSTSLPVGGDVSDNTGELESAVITISGLVTPATIVVTLDGKYTLRGGLGQLHEFSPDFAPLSGLGQASSMDVSLLRIGMKNAGGWENTFSLVLRPALEASNGEFERIGACTHSREITGAGDGAESSPGQENESMITII